MATTEKTNLITTANLLSILNNEEELIVKPLHSSRTRKATECGKIVSRLNRTLFEYRIDDQINFRNINSIFDRKIVLLNPRTKQVIIEFYHSRLPLLFKAFCKQDIRCLATQSHECERIGSIRKRLVFGKLWYDVYDDKHGHMVSLVLRKSHLRSRIQHRVPTFSILNNCEARDIGHIYPFSTDLERSDYGHAVAMKITENVPTEIKAILLIATLMIVCNF